MNTKETIQLLEKQIELKQLILDNFTDIKTKKPELYARLTSDICALNQGIVALNHQKINSDMSNDEAVTQMKNMIQRNVEHTKKSLSSDCLRNLMNEISALNTAVNAVNSRKNIG